MRKATPFLATLLAGLLVAGAAHAEKKGKSTPTIKGKGQTYSWVDENGVTHYGDSVPAEYSQREQRVLNSRGVEVGKLNAEMSAAEAAAYAAAQKEEARRRQHDMFLLSTYPSVKEIENVRDTRVEQIDAQIVASEAYIATITTRVDGLKQRAMNYAPYNTKPGARRMPDDLAEEMVRAMSELRTQNAALAKRKAERETVMEQFTADINRFKELRASAAARLDEASRPRKQ